MALALSHGSGKTICSADAPSNEVLVGTLDGIVRIERTNGGWSKTGHVLQGKHIHAILLEPESGVWFAGVSFGGIYASEDGGRAWKPRSEGLTQNDIYSLSAAKVNGKTRLFAGTEPAHLFVSDDLGLSWSEKPGLRKMDMSGWSFPGPPHIAHLKHINFEPANPHTIFASIEQGGLYVSRDDGETWKQIPGMYIDIHRCVINPVKPERMYVTGGEGLWVSTDAGKGWRNIFGHGSEAGGYPDQLVYKPSDPDTMLVSAGQKSPGDWRNEGTALTRISLSRDGGFTWEVCRGGLPDRMQPSIEAMTLEEAGRTVQVFAATTAGTVLWSEDGGATWSTIIEGLAPISKGPHYRPLVRKSAAAHGNATA